MFIIIVLIVYGFLIYRIIRTQEEVLCSLQDARDNYEFIYRETFGFPSVSERTYDE